MIANSLSLSLQSHLIKMTEFKKKTKLLTSSSNLWLFKEYFIYSIFAIFVIHKVQIKTVHLLKKDGLSSGFCAHPLSIRETISARWGISDGKLSSLMSGRCPCDTPYIICKGLVTSAKANGNTFHSSEAYYGLMHSLHSNLTQWKSEKS